MTAGAYVRQSKAAENAQGHACRQVCKDNSWPATAELRGGRRNSGDTGLAGSRWQTLPGACPCQKAGSHGRRAGCAAGKHGRQRARTAGSAQAAIPERGRAAAERGARGALGEAGAPPVPGTGAGPRSPAARRRRGQTGRRQEETGEQHPWRHGTAQPGCPERLPAAVQDTRGEDGGHPAAAPLTLRWKPPPRPWRWRGGRELTAAEGRRWRWPAAQRGTARQRRHRPSRAPPSRTASLPPSSCPPAAASSPRGRPQPGAPPWRPGGARSAWGVCGREVGVGHGPLRSGADPGRSPAGRPWRGCSKAPVGRLLMPGWRRR